mmetsp:Transcript_8415/g.28247  ORF Transcript_8415/g.28247 Transcript_8415/m.28247 type:complete len:99 (-) Transcript_8415:242-538(-)
MLPAASTRYCRRLEDLPRSFLLRGGAGGRGGGQEGIEAWPRHSSPNFLVLGMPWVVQLVRALEMVDCKGVKASLILGARCINVSASASVFPTRVMTNG